MERNYQFRERLLEVHKKGLRDDAIWTKLTGTTVDESWEIVYPADADRVLLHAAHDLRDFFEVSMNLCLRARPRKDGEPLEGRITLTDAAHTPALAPAYTEPAAYKLDVGDGITVCGTTPRGTLQGCFYLERRMGIHRGPIIERGTVEKKPLFSPRMVHSGFGLDDFPDAHINAAAHMGMDALLVFTKDLNITPHGYLDFNNLIYRAAGMGMDVYAYSYYKSPKHPDDPDAPAFYESTYGNLFKNCPGLRGVTLVGESVEFPSRDPHTSGCLRLEKKPGETRPSPGWYPCYDYPEWINLVKGIIRKYKPDADFVFWTYNWGYVNEEARIALIETLPTDISLQVTYEMFEQFHPRPGVTVRCVDYTLMFEGPGKYFTSEAIAAHRRGIPLYAMANTGGLTWDIGVVPYEPAPYQWKRRYDGMVKAHENWGLRGLMECHHYGFYPSFVSELANTAYWSPAEDYDTAMREIAARDHGEKNVDTVLETWRLWSDGIRHYVSTNPDQYGPFRIGPAYPLLFRQEAILESPPYAHFGNNRICHTMYNYDINLRANLDYEIESLTEMARLYEEGAQKLADILPSLTGRQYDETKRMWALGSFIAHAARTTIAVKKWFILKCKLLPPKGNKPSWNAGQEAVIKDGAQVSLTPDEVRATIDEMRAIAEQELVNARETIPLVEYDSRLGYEPSMEYMCDRAHLEWKERMTRRALAELDEIYEKGICPQ
ncbi:MAG: hypothetical protein ACOXZM_11440 [Eubacteriales bacterium]|jgi:hypothetical protein